MLTNARRDYDPWEILAGEASLDKTSSIVNNHDLFLIEEDLHLFKLMVYCSSCATLHFEFKFIFLNFNE